MLNRFPAREQGSGLAIGGRIGNAAVVSSSAVSRPVGLVFGLASAALGVSLLAGCGNGSRSETPTTGAYAPITAHPLVSQANRTDPDQGPKASADLYTYVTPLGQNRYRLEVTNTSAAGFVNEFTWFPGPGTKILAVTGATVDRGDKAANCRLTDGKISCRLSLRPPSCTCRGDGGSVAIRFLAKSTGDPARRGTVTFGGRIFVESQTLVPYFVPGSPDQKPSDLSDLPLCAKGQQSSREKPCLPTR
jgi:hypothetical protein